VRLTIERMRTLVLAAGVLLLAALVVFLVVGKGKNPFNRRDLPQRLGMEIQQEANGYTYVHAFGAHSKYRIHASKEVQLKNDRVELHDVEIDLFGANGSRVDRIAGDEFEYDEKSGLATAKGPVDMLLTRPAAAPTGSVKSVDQLAAVAESGGSGQVHVKTSGVTFDRNSGLVTTAQRVNFSMAQGAGSSMGATYDSQQGLLVLDRAVELTTLRGDESVQIHAQHAEFDRTSQLCRLRAATADYRGGKAAAVAATILFREDGSAVRLDAMNGFTLTTATGSLLAAPTGQLDFDEHNQPRHGRLEGGVTMESASQAEGWLRQVHGSAPTAELEFNAQGELRHAHLERGVAMDSEERSGTASAPLRLSRHWRSPIADVEFRDAGHGQIEPETVHGSGGVVVTSESRRGKMAASNFRFSADEMTGELGLASHPANSNSFARIPASHPANRDLFAGTPGLVLTALNGVGHASIAETTATEARQSTCGDRLEARFMAPAAAGAKQESGREAQIQSATVEGHVVLTQLPAAKPGAPAPQMLRATAGRADYVGAGEWLHLTLTLRVEDGALQLTADKVDVSRVSGDAFAHGNVKASWMDAGDESGGSRTRPAGSPAGQSSVSLGGQGPAHGIAAEVELSQTTGKATFRGQARLWQQGNSVAAPEIVLDKERKTLTAWTRDASASVQVVLVSASGTGSFRGADTKPGIEPGKEQAQKQEKSSQPSVIRMRGGDLKYSDVERKAVMHGGVLGAVVAEMGTATSVSNEVEVTLLPLGKNARKEGGQAQVDRMTARGHVVLTSEGRRGTGEQLVYTGATGEYVLTGTASTPPRIFDAARGSVSGEALIFNGRDDSVRVEGGGEKTRTETTAPR
jgi:lipopolysaccharide export system protein LptA